MTRFCLARRSRESGDAAAGAPTASHSTSARRARQWPRFKTASQIVPRSFGVDRLDRGRWRFDGVGDLRHKIDAHLLRPGFIDLGDQRPMLNEQRAGFDDENWPKLLLLLQTLFKRDAAASYDTLNAIAVDYRREFNQLRHQ